MPALAALRGRHQGAGAEPQAMLTTATPMRWLMTGASEMSKNDRKAYLTFSALVLALCLGATLAQAHDDDDEDERHERHEQHEHSKLENQRHASNIQNKQLKEECGSCHIVYPPNMLPAESWRALMDNLNKHFGSDASLDKATQRELSNLLQNQGKGRAETANNGQPIIRISQTSWFLDEHEDEVSPRTWRNPKIKSASNCGTCHTKADQGRFGEHEIRIPR
ncbi:MAG: cytochrome C [Gallionella sp.]|nr:cytochrome C [Gallionella sp.]